MVQLAWQQSTERNQRVRRNADFWRGVLCFHVVVAHEYFDHQVCESLPDPMEYHSYLDFIFAATSRLQPLCPKTLILLTPPSGIITILT
jgi:hypothetical protein